MFKRSDALLVSTDEPSQRVKVTVKVDKKKWALAYYHSGSGMISAHGTPAPDKPEGSRFKIRKKVLGMV